MSDRLASGSARLDAILEGGLPLNGINLIMGRPGSGKTILAQQYLFHNATAERPALYLSTVSEPLVKILRYGQSLSFFDKSVVGTDVIYEDLGQSVNSGGLSAVLTKLIELLREWHPALIVIDSFKALRAYAPDEGSFRQFLHDLAGHLSASAITSFWVGEYDRADATEAPEFAVADAIVSLGVEHNTDRESLVFQVLKLRGSGFISGKHAYRVSRDGIDVFPRLADHADGDSYDFALERISSGVSILDEMLADGYWRGASTLVAGPSGAGKTLVALHFVFRGVELGEQGIFATFQENPMQLERVAQGFSWSFAEREVELMFRPPVDLYLDEWVYHLLDLIEHTGAQRVAIDSLVDLRAACGDEIRFREYMYSFLQRCARRNVSVIMTQEVPELFGITRLSEFGISHVSDNVVLLQFLRGDSEVKRAITVLKTRGSAHDPRIRQFEITSDGLSLGDQFLADQSLA
ncbi:MAG TPA: ATPase domain-containing protein [Acidimicrobiales bacterium]|nr:ATPase domain-containing protein [Acidimicrobiales bacterium]